MPPSKTCRNQFSKDTHPVLQVDISSRRAEEGEDIQMAIASSNVHSCFTRLSIKEETLCIITHRVIMDLG